MLPEAWTPYFLPVYKCIQAEVASVMAVLSLAGCVIGAVLKVIEAVTALYTSSLKSRWTGDSPC